MKANRDTALHEAAVIFHVNARTPLEKSYFRGYLSGIAMRIAGGMDRNAPGAVAFEFMLDEVDEEMRAVGRGYRDGMEGKTIEMPGEMIIPRRNVDLIHGKRETKA